MLGGYLEKKTGYRPLSDESNEQTSPNVSLAKGSHKSRIVRFSQAALVLAVVLSLGFSIWSTFTTAKSRPKPAIRREWRSLNESQQLEYLGAVQCLASTPSKLHPKSNATLLDDFPWLHRNIGFTAHEAASFFSWHRYFVFVYESYLRQPCGYQGPMVYWDWSLDWEDPASSPIFDNRLGFGGNGNISGPVNEKNGYCLDSGPFAGLQTRYWETRQSPHCLSRNFGNDTGPGHFNGRRLRPKHIQKILSTKDFMKFLLHVENGPHAQIPIGIGGDFQTFTAPADPVFFLHHAQLDRLWWIWQNQSRRNRREYWGPSSSHSNSTASLDDVLRFKGLARDVTVREIMDTESQLLFYTYDSASVG